MSSTSWSINYDIPLDVDKIEEHFQPDEWPMHKDAWRKYREMRDTFFQDNDVIVAVFPRSGSHICWHIVDFLLHGEESSEYTFDDVAIIHRSANLNAHQGAVRSFNTHMRPCDVGHKVLLTGNRKVIHMVRNPKDSALSYHKICFDLAKLLKPPKSFEEWATDFCSDKIQSFGYNWIYHTRSWEEFAKRPESQVCFVTFEDFIKDSRKVIEKISKFLELDRSRDEIDKVVEKLQFHNLKKIKQSDYVEEFFAASQNKNPSFYQKGKIGSWKDAFTVALSEKFDAEIKKRMEGSKLYSLYY